MPSFDYVYDLIDKFKKENFSFVMSFLQKGKEADQVHVFYEYNTKEEAVEIIDALNLTIDTIRQEIGEEGGETDFNDEDEGFFN
jgi:NTP pyrophosphatase (non-canonical NTP hydrolase)